MSRFPRRTVPASVRIAATLVFLAALLCLAPPATAVNKTWIDATGQWDTSANWTPSGLPQAGDNVYLTQSDTTNRTVTYYNTTNPSAVLTSLRVDATGPGTMTLNMPNTHTLNVTTEYVGYSGKGTVTQSAGTHNAATLYLGNSALSSGSYTITGGTLSSSTVQYIGYSGTGTLNIQGAGQVSNTGTTGYLGFSSGSYGTAIVDGGGRWTNSGVLWVGYSGTGTLNIRSGGQVSNSDGYLGYSSGSYGTTTVDGTGGLSKWTNSGVLLVGYSGTGTLDIRSGGQVSNTDGYLGYYSGSSGTATVDGVNSKWTINSGYDLYVGWSGAGALNIQNGGQVFNGYCYIGYGSTSNGAATVNGANARWTNSRDLYVGRSGIGVLNIQNGGQVSNYYGYLGYYSGSSGTATVDGVNSKWTINSGYDLYVGYSGTGTLNMQKCGKVSNRDGYLGYNSGSRGTATVDGSGSEGIQWTNSGKLYVGYSGTGILSIQNGGQVSNTTGYLGYNSGSSGTATVDGTNSKWTNQGQYLYVGYSGTGTLNIQNGGQVSNNYSDGYLGYSSGSSGTATVDGLNSNWTNLRYLYVGNSGTGILNIRNGGQVSNNYDGYLGYESGSRGTATVDGTGSKWTNYSFLYVGNSGTGTLNIQNGGQVSNTTGYLGYNSGSSGTVTVDGTNSKWTNSANLYVGGYNGSGTGTLNIQNGGQVSNAYGCLGNMSGSIGTVTVDGSGSKWTNSGELEVGYSGTGTLNIQNGGQVSSDHAWVGDSSGSSSTATVDGSGSKWTNSAHLVVGGSGTGTLNIRNGGQVSNGYGYLGYFNGSRGTATVDGTGSKWTNSGALTVGNSGTGILNIRNGGQVSNNYDGYLGYESGSRGTATVDGAGSKWTNYSFLYVGNSGTGTLNIQNGGQVSNYDGYLGHSSGSSGTATVDGTGSKWTINSGYPLTVGYSGTGTLSIQNGGLVLNGIGYLGYNSGSSGTATVDGTTGPSTWTNSAELSVGYYGAGTLNIRNGGQVSNTNGYLGYFSGSRGTVTVEGSGPEGTQWTNSGDLFVGWSGTGTVSIQNGGKVWNYYDGYLGYNSGSSGTATVDGIGSEWINSGYLNVGNSGTGTLNIRSGGQVFNNYDGRVGCTSGSNGTATVGGIGSKWTNSGNLYVGSGGTGTLNIQNGGQVSNSYGVLGTGTGCNGTATVDGSGSKWTNSKDLYVGWYGTGTLSIQNGGQVSNSSGYLGYESGTSGTVTVDGVGSLWNNTGSLYVGGWEYDAGGTGSVTVRNGGQLAVGGTLQMWNPDSAVTVSGGTLTAGTLAGPAGTIRITDPVGGTALTVGSSDSDTFSGTIRDDTGPGSLTKVGNGTQTLGGANTYTGATAVNAGTLQLSGSLGNTAITVAPGATLLANAGSGVIAAGPNSSLTLNGGASSAGQFSMVDDAIGTFRVGSGGLTTVTGSVLPTLTFEIGNSAGSIDRLDLSTMGGSAGIAAGTWVDFAWLSGATSLAIGDYHFITAASGLSATAFTLANDSIIVGGHGYTLSLANSTATEEILTIINIIKTTYTLDASATATKIHVGGSSTITATITNTGAGSGNSDTLDYTNLTVTNAAQLTNTWPKAANPAPIATDNGTDTQSGSITGATPAGSYTFTPSVDSATNHTLLTPAVLQSTTPVTVDVYNLAVPNTVTGAIGNYHVGVAKPLSLQNTAPAGSYSEDLGATLTAGANTAGSGGSATVIAGGADSSNLLVKLGGSGPQTGDVTLTLTSTGTVGGVSNTLGVTSLTGQTVAVSGTGYNLASADATQTVNVGLMHVGGTKTAAVTLNNTAPADPTYTETLSSGAFSGTSAGFTAGGAVSGIVGGSSGSGTLTVGLAPTLAAGHQTGSTTLALNSNEVNSSGLGVTSIAPQTITVTGDVFNGSGRWTLSSGASGSWGAHENWTDANGVHAAPGTFSGFDNVDSATFDGTGSTATVNLDDAAPSLKSITFSGGTSYQIAQGTGSNKLTFKSNTGPATVMVSGSHTINAPVTLASDTTISVTGLSDALAISGNIDGNGRTLTKSGIGALTAAAITAGTVNHNGGSLMAGDVTADGFHVASGTATIRSLTGANPATSTVSVAAGQTLNVDQNILNVNTLTVDGTATLHSLSTEGTASETSIVRSLVMNKDGGGVPLGTLDLLTGNLVVDYTGSTSPLVEIANLVKSGANFDPGTGNLQWNGTGITSSAIPSGPDPMLYTVGVREAVDAGSFGMADLTDLEGVTLGSKAVVAKYTWIGDVNMDGVVDQNDYDVMDYYQVFGTGGEPFGAGWWTGDLNGDGVVNQNDYDLADYGQVFQDGSTLGRAHSLLGTAPEPATLALVALGVAGTLLRRRGR